MVAGEALVDLIVRDGPAVDAHLGGGPFNAARTIARLGQPVAFLGALSNDLFGQSLRAALENDGVVVDGGLTTELPTTLAMVALDEAGVARYQFYAEGTSAPALDAARRDGALPREMYAVHVGGLGLVFEPSASTLIDLLERIAGSALVSLDPNSRPMAIADLDDHRKTIRRVIALADIVKISDEDALLLFPGAAPEQSAREVLAMGPSLVILSRGPRGVLVLTASDEIEVAAPEVELVDTVGAGDAFSGAMLADFRRRGLIREELRDHAAVRTSIEFAVAVAGVVCTRAGADPPYLDELTPPPPR